MTVTESQSSCPKVALIGFGEAGETFARAAAWDGCSRGWDLLPERRKIMASCGVEPGSTCSNALAGTEVVLSLVTADAALDAARDYAPLLGKGNFWLDMNSVAPATKRAAAEVIEARGVHYVDVAVMAPVDKGMAVPLLVSGPAAADAVDLLTRLGFTKVRMVGDEVGRASAIKLCRSVMVKGLEALTAEMVLVASEAGVLDEVLASLDANEKQVSWSERADYNLDRMLIHGQRRSAEMVEACAMLKDLGIAPQMSGQTALLQQQLGALDLAPPPTTLSAKLDAIRANPAFKGEK